MKSKKLICDYTVVVSYNMTKFEIITIDKVDKFPIPNGCVIKKRSGRNIIYYNSNDKTYIKRYNKP